MNQEVNKIVQELYSCLPNDRNKFNSIMQNLKEKFLSSQNNHPIDYNKNLPNLNLSSKLINENMMNANNNIPNIKNNTNTPNFINNSTDINASLNPLKAISNFQPINLPTYNVENKLYNELDNDELGNYININNDFHTGNFNDNLYENKIQMIFMLILNIIIQKNIILNLMIINFKI